MTPFNILFVFPLPFHPERGGVERVTDVLTKEFIRRGHNVFYLHKKGSLADYGEYVPPAQAVFLPQRKLKAKENIEFYHRFLKENKIDFIINQMGLSSNYCPFTDVPKDESGFPKTISVMHNPPLLNHDHLGIALLHPKKKTPIPILRNILRALTFPIYKHLNLKKRRKELTAVAHSCDCICLLSDGYRKELERVQILPDSPCHIRTIANPCALTANALLSQKKKQLLYIGRLDAVQKAPHRLIPIWKELCQRHPDWELVIVGDGALRKKMEKLAAPLPRISLVGSQSPAPFYQDSGICCLTSTFEGFPMVVLEAMAFGCIPFAYNSFPAIDDIFGSEAANLTAPPFNSKLYIERLSQLMQDEKKRMQLAELSLQKAKEYTVEAITDRWEHLLQDMLKK